jgi:hypothetical protein
MNQLLKGALAAVFAGGLLIPSAACTINPTVSAWDNLNQCGGTIGVNGNGFTPNGEVNVQVLGLPDHQGFVDMGNTRADGAGNFSGFQWPWSLYYNGGPGCAWDSHASKTVTIMGKDLATGSVTFTTTTVTDCGVSAGECPA